MPDRRRRALIAAFAATLSTACVPSQAVEVDYVGTFVWNIDDPDFGGFSGIKIADGGNSFYALSDRANLFRGNIIRDTSGRIREMNVTGRTHLKDSDGNELPAGYLGDSEGLAVTPDGRVRVSFEGLSRVALYTSPDAAAQPLPRPPGLPEKKTNQGLEALAVQDDDTLYAIPEGSPGPDQPFPVLRFRDGKWDQPFTIRRDESWLPVGSDFGPDGWFYLLERGFHGLLGFSSRVRRFRFDETSVVQEELLLQTSPLKYDNLEGLSVWHDGQDIRLTMISDDNFLFVQRTELVEYRLHE